MTKNPGNREKYVATTIAVVLLAFFLALTFYVVPSFERLLAVAEFDLPPVTKLTIDISPYWNIFGALAVTGCLLVFQSRNKLGWFLIAIAGLALITVIPCLIYAMYEPIFQYEPK